jgi:hypothetical protein
VANSGQALRSNAVILLSSTIPPKRCGWVRDPETRKNMAMITLSESIIVLLGFAIPATYLFFVSRYVRAAERETAEAESNDRRGLRTAA